MRAVTRQGRRKVSTHRLPLAAADACGRVSAEQITPYPPGIPAVVPGERLNAAVIDYLRDGLKAGMNVPDAADSSLERFRVTDR